MSNTSMLQTGVSDYLKNRKSKQYEFAEKPNYINPSESSASIERDSQPSPNKKDSIVRRHTENYGTKLVPDETPNLHLTPCRWDRTGWKYSNQNSGYFENENKKKNMIGYSGYKFNSMQNSPTKLKTQYQSSFKDKHLKGSNSQVRNATTFCAQKGIPNQANYISECYPAIPTGANFSSFYQREANEKFNIRKNSLNITGSTQLSTPEQSDEHKKHRRHHSKPQKHLNPKVHLNRDHGLKTPGSKHQSHTKNSSEYEKYYRNQRHHSHRKHGGERHGKDHRYHSSRRHHKSKVVKPDPMYSTLTREKVFENYEQELDDDNSPLKIDRLAKMEKDKLKMMLKTIKEKKANTNTQNLSKTMYSVNKMMNKKQFDGSRTFVSGPEIKKLHRKDGRINVTMNNDRTDPRSFTLGGVFMPTKQRSQYNNAVAWAGNIYSDMKAGFNRKRTFITEWQSAANNRGVFMNK